MPTPVAHTLSGCCLAAAAARRFPETATPAFVGALLLAANLPDVDFAAAALGATHQGLTHSLGFVLVGALPLSLLSSRARRAPARAWGLLVLAGALHLLLDLVSVDTTSPVGIPLLWPVSGSRWHSPLILFPGVDRSSPVSVRNLFELLVEVALLLPALLLLLRRTGARAPVSGGR